MCSPIARLSLQTDLSLFTDTHSRTHARTHALSVSLFLTHTHSLKHTHYLSLTHITRTHTPALSLSNTYALSQTHTLYLSQVNTLSYSLSLSFFPLFCSSQFQLLFSCECVTRKKRRSQVYRNDFSDDVIVVLDKTCLNVIFK